MNFFDSIRPVQKRHGKIRFCKMFYGSKVFHIRRFFCILRGLNIILILPSFSKIFSKIDDYKASEKTIKNTAPPRFRIIQ